MIVFGNRLFGKVDRVPGHFHVATKFFHIDYVPLIPGQTWVVFSQNGKQWRGVPIPISAKSIFLAWGRMGFGIAFVIMTVFCMVMASDHLEPTTVGMWAATVGLGVVWGLLMWLPFLTRASHKRVMQIASLLKLSPEATAQLSALYGLPPDMYGRGFEPVARSAAAPKIPMASRAMAALPVEKPVEDPPGSIPLEPPLAPPRDRPPGIGMGIE